MANPKDLPRDIGGFIRDLRRNAKISLRQLAEQAGVSNPYLSQIERGLRRPSAEVLQQLASALRVSTPVMYLRAGLLDDRDGQGVLAAIAADDGLTMAQKQALSQIYETFRRENARLADATAATAEPAEHSQSAQRTEPAEPAESAEPAELVEPVGPVEPIVPAEPVVPPKPVVSPQPLASVQAPSVEAGDVPEQLAARAADAVLESVAVAETGAAPAPSPAPSVTVSARKTIRKAVRTAVARAVEQTPSAAEQTATVEEEK